MIDADLKEWIEKKKNDKFASKRIRKSVLDKLFGDNKKAILDLVYLNNMPIKKIYDELNEKGFFGDIQYSSFLKWVRRNKPVVEAEIQSDFQKIIVNKSEDDVVGELLVISQNEEVDILLDSREMFYGFDMNNEPDPLTNPLPQMYEISKDYIFNIFLDDTALNNEKVIKILLFDIKSGRRNIYKKSWSYLLMKDGENIQEYYDRLQYLINTNSDCSLGLTNLTSLIEDIAYSCGHRWYKTIRERH
ncbi:hypothetical protein [Sulfuricurvum sp.]|uniref:hypothetical protein n=1 Tax=Sulfuricurvum sp. TaxID=2025608 RepID=UPI00263A0EF6|nr:hypothetical protein [Sulfuricurvum sp.]MDD3595897.1 hypothetical protein [Sulfuricurvum sp.]